MDGINDAVCFPREKCNSNPLHFTSGLEFEPTSPPDSLPEYVPLKRLDTSPPGKDLATKKPPSPKPSKRTRKMSLFSFHFNSKQEKSHNEDKHEKSETKSTRTRRISTPSRTSPMPYEVPKFSFSSFHGSFTGSTASSLNSSRENSPPLSPKASESTRSNVVEKENSCIREIIFETLKLQFEGITSYDREICDRLGKNVSQMVKRRVEVMKESLGLQFKIVAVVYVAAVRDKGIDVVSQCLMDPDRDNFTAATFRNGHIFVMGAVMAAQCL